MNRDFESVDVDLLADYIGGALDGSPEHATVAALIAGDDAWRTEYERLAEGMAAVGSELNALGAEPEPMPADVVERLDRAFTKPAGPRLVAVGGDARPARTVPATARARRARRWAVPVAVAAALLAFAGFGIDYGLRGTGSTSSAANSTAGQAESAPRAATGGAVPDAAKAAALAALPPAGDIVSTNTDYRHATLGTGILAGATKVPGTYANTNSRVAASLARLEPPDALLACLNAIAAENAAGPIAVQSVDYARYAGAPAVVVRFKAANGAWAWATGPDCGTPGLGANRLDAAKVG